MAGKIRVRQSHGVSGVLVLADGTLFYGTGFGAEGEATGELCYNTAMTGYQEAMTDPAQAGKIITFTFPHIGNTGANPEDTEGRGQHALGCVLGQEITGPSNFRATEDFATWLKIGGQIAVAEVDTRAIMRRLRQSGPQNAVIAHHPEGKFDIDALRAKAQNAARPKNTELLQQVSTPEPKDWDEGLWTLGQGYAAPRLAADAPHVVVLDFGVKKTMLRQLVAAGARVTVVPATASFDDIAALETDGLFLSDGPGDPTEIFEYAGPVIQAWLKSQKPLFGVGLGHRLLGLAAGATLMKRKSGHHGTNHPVQTLAKNHVEIVNISQQEAVDKESLPASVRPTHISLFDHSLCGLAIEGLSAFSVEFHPEASPGPQENAHLFADFVRTMKRK